MRYLVLLAFSLPAFSEVISFGVKGGLPLNGVEANPLARSRIENQRWLAGPTVEFHLGSRFSLGVDALYRRGNLDYSETRNGTTFFTNTRIDHWEVPIYGKYRFTRSGVRPFVTGGIAASRSHRSGEAGCTPASDICTGIGILPRDFATYGGAWLAGGGVEWKAGRVTIAPEFRYTGWIRGYFAGTESDQSALMLGIRF